MEDFYWKLLTWIVQLTVFIPLSVFATVQWQRYIDQKNSKLTKLIEGTWCSSFMLTRTGRWVDQEVEVRRSRWSRRLFLEATGKQADLDWKGHLEPHGTLLVGAWENSANPLIVGSQTLNLRFLLSEGFAVGSTTAADESIEVSLRLSTWIMARKASDLEKGKKATLPN